MAKKTPVKTVKAFAVTLKEDYPRPKHVKSDIWFNKKEPVTISADSMTQEIMNDGWLLKEEFEVEQNDEAEN